MSIEVKMRRGTTAEHAEFAGAVGEITVDTDKKVLVVHDGTTAGGNPQDNAERIKSKAVIIEDFTGKNGYIMAYDETNDQFILKKDEGAGGGGLTDSANTFYRGLLLNISAAYTQSIFTAEALFNGVTMTTLVI